MKKRGLLKPHYKLVRRYAGGKVKCNRKFFINNISFHLGVQDVFIMHHTPLTRTVVGYDRIRKKHF